MLINLAIVLGGLVVILFIVGFFLSKWQHDREMKQMSANFDVMRTRVGGNIAKSRTRLSRHF